MTRVDKYPEINMWGMTCPFMVPYSRFKGMLLKTVKDGAVSHGNLRSFSGPPCFHEFTQFEWGNSLEISPDCG